MKMSPAPLLVGLHDKLRRVARHWALVDEALAPSSPLRLLSDVGLEGVVELLGRLPALRLAVEGEEQGLKLARAAYERRKGVVHEWMKAIKLWMRADYQGTDYYPLARRMPARGASYKVWHQAAMRTLAMWKKIVVHTLPPLPGPDEPWEFPLTLDDGRTVEQFASAVTAFEAADAALIAAEVNIKIARGGLERARGEGTALLMAYGHGVRARLGNKGALARSVPRVWQA